MLGAAVARGEIIRCCTTPLRYHIWLRFMVALHPTAATLLYYSVSNSVVLLFRQLKEDTDLRQEVAQHQARVQSMEAELVHAKPKASALHHRWKRTHAADYTGS